MRFVLVACVTALAFLCSASDAASSTARLLRRQVDTTTNYAALTPTATLTTTNATTPPPQLMTDANGRVWHVVDGSRANATTMNATTTTTTPTTANATTSATVDAKANATATATVDADANETLASDDATGPVQLDLKEHASAGAPAPHKTPMLGFVIIGAMAILCVGIAASVAKRRQAQAGGDGGHH